jgi:hypothetical protein
MTYMGLKQHQAHFYFMGKVLIVISKKQSDLSADKAG